MQEVYRDKAGEKCHLFRYMTFRSLNRPRDFITWVIELAKNCNSNFGTLIKYANVINAEAIVSERMRVEFENELLGSKRIQYPKLPFDLLGIIAKNTFSFIEFKAYYDFFDINGILSINAMELLGLLFKYSIIGYRGSDGYFIFRHDDQRAKLDLRKNIVVTACLFKALNLPASAQHPKENHEKIQKRLEDNYDPLLFYQTVIQ